VNAPKPPLTVRSTGLFALVAVIAAFAITRFSVNAPAFTDAYYHLNGAARIATGLGLTEPYLWTYLGAPDRLPDSGVYPSHLYWMPLTSIIAAGGLGAARLLGHPVLPFADYTAYPAAQLPFTLLFAAAAVLAWVLGGRLAGTRRAAWVAGLLMLCSGFFARFWGTIDTFAPFAVFGAGCVFAAGLMAERARDGRPVRPWLPLVVGGLAGLCHLTRNDGILLLGVGGLSAVWAWPRGQRTFGDAVYRASLVGLGYLLIMAPWWARNMVAVGVPLPTGGAQAVFYTEYNDLFTYPPTIDPARLLSGGAAAVWASRADAIVNNLGTFVAVQGQIVFAPLMLLGVWRTRRRPLTVLFALYALAVHGVMTLVFPFPGYRGGLLHSAAALMPFWCAYTVIGLDAALKWAARRRRWHFASAQRVFTAAALVYAAGLTGWLLVRTRVPAQTALPAPIAALQAALPADARVIINDPAAWYAHTGMGGTVLPNADAAILPVLAARHRLTHLVIETTGGVVQAPAALTRSLEPLPPFLVALPSPDPTVRLYAILPDLSNAESPAAR
jgi:hypothetical protein